MASENDTVAEISKEQHEFAVQVYGVNTAPSTEVWKLADRIESAHKREISAKDAEISELRECLKEAIREKCPFTRMSCKHDEPCDYECGTEKWRKALKGSNNATK